MSEAIPILVDQLMEIRPVSVNNMADLDESLPAGRALIDIGEPAVPAVERKLENTKSRQEQLLLTRILYCIKGNAWLVDYLNNMKDTPNLSRSRREELRDYGQSLTK